MAIVAFWSDERKETGQTLSMVALSTYMAIEHNYKILNVSTSFRDTTLENCYWDLEKENEIVKGLTNNNAGMIGIEAGVEGLAKVIRSNRTSNDIVSNYSRVVFNNRLDILCSSNTTDPKEYLQLASIYPDIINLANKTYDLVFVDISKRIPKEQINRILEIADVIVVNITQKLTMIDRFNALRQENEFFKKNNILLNIGRYDNYSKYNIKNVSRYLKMKRNILAIPYNTLFFESCAEGRVAEYFLKLRNLESDDRNHLFVGEIANMCKELVYTFQELQIKM